MNDGPQDRTAEIAAHYSRTSIQSLIRATEGYGAAIKAGFAAAKGELLRFLDAGGTCDPVFFQRACRVLQEAKARNMKRVKLQ